MTKAKHVTHLNDTTITVSDCHVVGDRQTFKMLDKTALQVTTVACLYCRVHQTLATSASASYHSHLSCYFTCHTQNVQLYALCTSLTWTKLNLKSDSGLNRSTKKTKRNHHQHTEMPHFNVTLLITLNNYNREKN